MSVGSMPLPWIFLCLIVGIVYGSWNQSDSSVNSASASYYLSVEQWGQSLAYRTAVASPVRGKHSQVVVRIR